MKSLLDAAIGIRVLPSVRLPASVVGGEPPPGMGILVILDGCVVGGGIVPHGGPTSPSMDEPSPAKRDTAARPVSVHECWMVDDLQAQHWAELIGPARRDAAPTAAVAWVGDEGAAAATRALTERLSRHHARALERAACRAEGVLAAFGTAFRSGADVGADVARATAAGARHGAR